jgi:hypothetical protein
LEFHFPVAGVAERDQGWPAAEPDWKESCSLCDSQIEGGLAEEVSVKEQFAYGAPERVRGTPVVLAVEVLGQAIWQVVAESGRREQGVVLEVEASMFAEAGWLEPEATDRVLMLQMWEAMFAAADQQSAPTRFSRVRRARKVVTVQHSEAAQELVEAVHRAEPVSAAAAGPMDEERDVATKAEETIATVENGGFG